MFPRANTTRLQIARKRRGLTKTTLAKRAGFTTKTIYEFESGRMIPSEEALQAIAEATRFPIKFFFRGDLEEPSLAGTSFRSLKAMTATEQKAALSAGALALELSQWIEQRFELPAVDIPDLRHYQPETAAASVRKCWQIGERPIGNMIHLLESRGIRVFSLSERTNRIDAFSLWQNGIPFVFLNTRKTSEHSRMDAAHELGHLVLHRHGIRGRDFEKEAQAFGAAFLMPDGGILGHVPKLTSPTVEQLIPVKHYWRVSLAALAHRLNRLNLITDWSYKGLCVQISQFGRTKEPLGLPKEESQVLAKVFKILKDSGLPRTEVARQLDLYQTDVDALIFGLGLTASPEEGTPENAANASERRKSFKVVE